MINKDNLGTTAVVFLMGFLILWYSLAASSGYVDYTDKKYTEFASELNVGNVDVVVHKNGETEMLYALFDKESRNLKGEELENYQYPQDAYYKTTWPDYDTFTKELLLKGVRVRESTYNTPRLITKPALFLALGILLLPLIMGRLMGHKVTGMIKSSSGASSVTTTDDGTRFSDIIGHDEILGDIKFISEMIQEPERGEEMGVMAPKGVLLSGPPGTGKTMIAKAIANEAGVNFISANASSFIEMYVGVGAKRIRELFKEARQKAPCVLFIDEIDAVGGKRNSRGRNSEDDKTVNALLQEMDGFNSLSNVFVIAATNTADSLDDALVRSGRFDRQIAVNPPKNWEVRLDLFKHYLANMNLSEDLDLDAISKQTVGFTGADIKSICNEAGMIALMKGRKFIDSVCMDEAIDKKIFKGNRSKKKAIDSDRKIVAYHEAGHAVMTYLCKLPIARASIAGTTSGVGGAVFQAETESMFMTKETMLQQVMICYAGRASEEIKFDIPTTGASNDITKATQLIHDYVEKYGFDEKTGLLDMQVFKNRAALPEEKLMERMQEISATTYEETKQLLDENYYLVECLAGELLEKESLSGEEITTLLRTA